MTVEIREFRPEDAEAASRVLIAAFRSFLEDKIDESTLKAFSPQALRHSSAHKGEESETVSYVADDSGDVIGYIRGGTTARGLGSLSIIGVSPDCLHKGVGTGLMKKLETFWQKNKTRKVSTCVSAHNGGALLFYLKNGFRPVGYRRDHFIEGVDEILLDRFLK